MLFVALVSAHAASLELHVQPSSPAAAVAAVVRSTDGVATSPCNDAARDGDLEADGVWTCRPVAVSASMVDVYVVVGDQLVDGGPLAVSGSAMVAGLSVTPSGASLAVGDGALTRKAGPPVGPTPIVLARIIGYGSGPAPVLEVGAPGQSARQLGCHDDGRFPDRAMNDGDPGCIGVGQAGAAKVQLIGGDGARRDFGGVDWPDGALSFLTVDVAKGTASIEPFDLPLPMKATTAASSPANGATGGSPQEGGGAAASGGATTGAGATATATSNGLTPTVWATGLAGCGVGVGLLVLASRPRGRVRSTLRRVEGAPLLPGGPSLADPASILHVPDPLAALPELLTVVGAWRRVVLVLPPGVAVPAVPGAAAWVATIPDALEVAGGARELAANPGLPVAVLIVGADTLRDPGAERPDALGRLLAGLPGGVWVGVLLAPGEGIESFAPAFDLTGPPWRGVRR